MTAIVMNTLTGAVTEYAGFDFHGITPGHAGNALGLYALGGDTDAGQPIDAYVLGGDQQPGGATKARPECVWFSLPVGQGAGKLVVKAGTGAAATMYEYPVTVLPDGRSRGVPGRGLREAFAAVGYKNQAGADFQLDSIEAAFAASKTRRI